MLDLLPSSVSYAFVSITALTFVMVMIIMRKSRIWINQKNRFFIVIGILIWLLIQALLARKGVYHQNTDVIPPPILLFGIAPVIMLFIILFISQKGRQLIDSLPLLWMTYIHLIRIPVKLVLYWLSLYKAVPKLMTFEGINFDILAGLTAPFIAYFGIKKRTISRQTVLIWNFISLALLLNVVVIAFLSAPSPLQKLSFDQPNLAALNFPFCWLPTFIVPVVVLAHITSIRKLLQNSVTDS